MSAMFVGDHQDIGSLIAASRRYAKARGQRVHIYGVPQPDGWWYAPFSIRYPDNIGREWPKEGTHRG